MVGAPIEITQNFGGGSGGTDDWQPKHVSVELHHIFVDSEAARQRIVEIIDEFPHFGEGDVNTLGNAHTTTEVVDIEELGKDAVAAEWKSDGHTNPVRLRWLTNTAIKLHSSRALAVVDLKDAKFDVRVQVQSKADKLTQKLAREIVEAFYQNSDLVYESIKPFKFGTLRVPKNAPAFTNGLYERYTGFNKFERPSQRRSTAPDWFGTATRRAVVSTSRCCARAIPRRSTRISLSGKRATFSA